MGKLTVAVCDTFDGYRNRFVTYLVEHRVGEFAVYAFSTPKLFLEVIEEQTFDVVIIGYGFEDTGWAVRERGIPILLLRDSPPEQTAEDCSYAEEKKKCMEVFRYQSMEAILQKLQVLTGGHRMESALMEVTVGRLEVFGVCSSIGHEMQMPFSLAMASRLAEKSRVLYVNLMEHSGFLELFQLQSEYDLGDIVLRLRNKRLHREVFLRSVYQMRDFFYIPPFLHPENLHDFHVADYLAVLEFLEQQTDFEAVIFDFGDGVSDLAEMLAACGGIYCLVKGGYYYECRTNQFTEYLCKKVGEKIAKRVQMVNLPYSARHIRRDGDVLRQLLWSEFGDFVRSYLTGGML